MKKLFSAFTSSRKENKRVKSRRLRLEALEDRQMLDSTGLMDVDVVAFADVQTFEAQEADVPISDTRYSGRACSVTIPWDVVNPDDDWNADGSPRNISLREAYDYAYRGLYDTISIDCPEKTIYLNDSINYMHYSDGKVWLRGNDHTITTQFKSEAFNILDVYAARFDDVKFENCGGAGKLGGAISYRGTETLELVNCQFNNCTANKGGAIYLLGSSPIGVYNSKFNNCSVFGEDGQGGAIYADGVTTLAGTRFTDNNAAKGGAVYLSSGSASIQDCNFSRNGVSENTQYGGAVYLAETASMTISGSIFAENGASNESREEHDGEYSIVKSDFTVRGGAIYNAGSISSVTNSDFYRNCGYYGGAIYNKGGVSVQGEVIFSENDAYLGGAVYVHAKGFFTVDEGVNKFSGNVAHFSDRATQNHGSGGAIYVSSKGSDNGFVAVASAEFIDNQAYKYGGGIANYGLAVTQNNIFAGNIAAVGGAVCNANEFKSTGDTFNENGAYCGGDQESLEGYDWLYTAGGNGGAIYSANNATTGNNASLTLVDIAVFEGNNASRSGGAINVVSGSIEFAYRETSSFIFANNLSMCGMGGAIVLANGLENVAFTDQGATQIDPSELFMFGDNYAWYAPTIGVTGKDGYQMRRVVRSFGFDYSNLTPDQVDTFTHYDDQLVDGKLTYEYLAELCNWLSPSDSITVCYIGDGSTGEVTICPGEEVRLSQLGVPTTSAGVVPGSYKLEFYYGNPYSDPVLHPESKTAFELIVGVTEADDYMMMRRIEILGYDDYDVVPMTGFSFVTYDRPVEAVIIDWGDGSNWWVSQVESFSTNVYHMFPDKIEWDPESGTPDPNVYTVTADFALVGSKRHITVSFQYHAHASSKDWHVRPGETGTYEHASALLDTAFAELDLFDI